MHGLLSGGCGDLSAERKFLSDKVYRRDDRGIVEVESFSLRGLAFVVIHNTVGWAARSCGSGERSSGDSVSVTSAQLECRR
jgi:hypothetical protein